MRHSAVWACLAAIAEALQQLPLQEVVLRNGVMIRRDPPSWMFDPAPGVSWETWIWQQAWSLAECGNAYAWVTERDKAGYPTALIPLAAAEVEWKFDRAENRWYPWVDKKRSGLFPVGNLVHVSLYTRPGNPEGMSPIAYHAETIGVGLAAQEFGARFFGDGGHPTMIVRPETDPGDEGARRLKEKIMGVMRGNREVAVIPKSIDLERVQIAPDESQFLDTMRYSGEDIARIFGVPPEKVALAVSGSNITYSNVGDRNSDWRVSGLSRYAVAFEAALSRLVPNGQRRVIRFNFDAFLRADLKARADAYKVFAQIGALSGTPVMTSNEMRSEEGREPLEGGDTFSRGQMQLPMEDKEQGQ
jgi:HK97 family phage portal protein